MLYELGEQRLCKWRDYLARLKKADVTREPQANDHYLS